MKRTSLDNREMIKLGDCEIPEYIPKKIPIYEKKYFKETVKLISFLLLVGGLVLIFEAITKI